MKLSILILSWNRPENINKILTTYNDYNIIDDIIVWNNKRTQELNYLPEWEGKIKFINSHDFGLNTRFIGALLCKNEWVLTNDDDILLSEGTINHFSEWAKNHPDRTYTLHGRNPTAQNTYADGVENVVVPKETDKHLTRATCYKKKYVIDYIRFIMDNDIKIEANKGGGEDIIFSYIVSSLTKRRPLVIPAGYNNKELPQIDALHNRFPDVHKQGRTDIMRLCQEKLKI